VTVSDRLRREDLQRWVDAGLLRQEQMDAIDAFEARSRVPVGMAPHRGRRVSLAAEVLGYVGAILAAVGVVLAVTGAGIHLGTGGALALLAAATFLFGAGFFTIRTPEPAFVRLASVLGFLSSVTLAAFVGVLLTDALDVTGAVVPVTTGLVSGAYSLELWRRLRRGLQQFAVFGALVTLVTGALDALVRMTPTGFGVAIGAVGVLWLVLAATVKMAPPGVARALGGITLLAGAEWLVVDHRALGTTIGVLAAIVLMTWGALERSGMLVGVGSVGLLAFVPQLVVLLTEGTGGNTALHVALGLFLAGSVVLAVAVMLVRHGHPDAGRDPGGSRGPGGSPSLA
jgi:hypothetical protein